MEPIAANATVTEHTRGPTPRHGRSELKATPPWRESLSSRGFRGPYLQLHLEAQGLTEENLTALGPLRDSYLRMRATESAQLPLSLEGSEGNLRATVQRVAALGLPPGTSAATTARSHHPLSLRMELERGLVTGAAFEERRRARSHDILNAQAERERATAKARLILPPPPPVPSLPPPPPVPRLPMEEETPITPAPGCVTMAAPMAPPTTTAPSMASSPAKAMATLPAKAASSAFVEMARRRREYSRTQESRSPTP